MKRSREEDAVLGADALRRLAQRLRAGHDLAELLLQDLRVEQLLRVLPLVERLGLVEALVALQADQRRGRSPRRRPSRARSCRRRPAPRRAPASPACCGQEDHRRDVLAADVALLVAAASARSSTDSNMQLSVVRLRRIGSLAHQVEDVPELLLLGAQILEVLLVGLRSRAARARRS